MEQELKNRIEMVKQQIQQITTSFKRDTGFTISEIKAAVIDAKSQCGPEWLPGEVTLTITV